MSSISFLCKLFSLGEKYYEKEFQEVWSNDTLHIFLKAKRKTFICKECGSTLYIKEWKTRTTNHSLLHGDPTILHLKFPRLECKKCHKTFSEKYIEFPKACKVSIKTIIDTLELFKEWTSTNASIAKALSISPTTAQNIFDKYVNPKRKTLPSILSIDEVYGKGQFDEPYVVIFYDFINKKIVDCLNGRSKWDLGRYFNNISKEERDRVKVISIDMWEPYLDVAQTYFPNATVIIDNFHVMQNIKRALDKTRCRIMRQYTDEKSIEYYLLKKHNALLTTAPNCNDEKEYNHKLKRYVNRYDLKEMLINIDDELLIAANFYSVYKRFNSGNDLNNLSDTFLMQLSKPKIYWKFLNLYKSSKCYKHGKNTS